MKESITKILTILPNLIILIIILLVILLITWWTINYRWFYFESILYEYSLENNLISYIFFLRVVLITTLVWIFSIVYINHSKLVREFNVWLIIFVISIVTLILRERWWVLFLGWEGLGLRSFWLVAYYGNWTSINGAIITIITNRLGDLALILSSIYWLQNRLVYIELPFILMLIILFAICTKRAQLPFFSWLPRAIRAPTPISALVHRRTLVTAGLYLLVKFNWVLFSRFTLRWWLGLITLIAGSLAAIVDCDLKKVVAFSTLSQLGLLIILFRTGSLLIIIFHLISHAFFKRTLFICVGICITIIYGNQRSHLYGRSLINRLIHSRWLYLALINLRALPFVRGFYSKESGVLRMVSQRGWGWRILTLLALSLTVGYSWRLITSIRNSNLLPISNSRNLALNMRGTGITIAILLSLGYFWSTNLCMREFDLRRVRLILIISLLALGLVFSSWINLWYFYYLTRILTIKLSFRRLRRLNSSWHLVWFIISPIRWVSWQAWLIILVLCLVWLL